MEDKAEHTSGRVGLDTEFRKTKSECRRNDCEGQLWYDSNEVVCARCGTIIDIDEQRRQTLLPEPWKTFWNNRPTYRTPDGAQKKVIGSFVEPHDWLTAADTDRDLTDIAPTDFYG